MNHLVFLFLFVAFMTLCAWTISTVLLYTISRKRLLVGESLVGLSLMLIMGAQLIKHYGLNCGLNLHIPSMFISIIGTFVCLLALPLFTHALSGKPISRLEKRIFVGIAMFFLMGMLFMPKNGQWDFAGPYALPLPGKLSLIFVIGYSILLYGTLGYYFITGLVAGKSIGDKILKRLYSITFGTCLVFILPQVVFIIRGAEAAAIITLSSMFIALSIEILYFSIFFSKQPVFLYKGGLTSNFISRFQISDREQQIITLLLDAKANKEIAESLFISPRTVENHLASIYQKTSVCSRLQLINLIRVNATT